MTRSRLFSLLYLTAVSSIIFIISITVVAQENEPVGSSSVELEEEYQDDMVFQYMEDFPTLIYRSATRPRAIERGQPPSMNGDPRKGKALAYDRSKGRCLNCHVLGADGEMPGDVGPNLSAYALWGRDAAYTFQQIWDARAHNPNTVMPPFGVNELLTPQEVVHIVAYMNTLTTPIATPKRRFPKARNFYVAGEDFTRADEYIEEGEALFRQPGENGKACVSCHTENNSHGPDLKGVASTYPKYLNSMHEIIDLEERINLCRIKGMESEVYGLGGHPSNLLSAYVKYLSRNSPINIATNGPAARALERGKRLFHRKTGQLNFSCADCHNISGGKWLRDQAIYSLKQGSQFSRTAATWPKHVISEHELGLISLQQRIRYCHIVTHTEPLALGSPEYTDLELYLSSLANGSPMLAPTMSKLRGEE